MKGKWVLLSVALVLVAIAAGALSSLRKTAALPARPAAGAAPVAPEEISLAGQVRAREVILVPAPVEGTLDFVAVEVGDEVGEGQLLARIKNTMIEAFQQTATEELERASNRVNMLESQLIASRLEASRSAADAARSRAEHERIDKIAQRQQMLYKEGATPRLVYEKAQKDLETARKEYEGLSQLAVQVEARAAANLRDLDAAKRALEEKTAGMEAAQADIEAAEVVAPVAGVVIGIRSKAGDEVQYATADLFQIALDLTQMEVVLEPEPPLMPLFAPGLSAAVYLAERPGESIAGAVREVDGGRVIVEFRSPSPEIRPGLSAQVKIRVR